MSLVSRQPLVALLVLFVAALGTTAAEPKSEWVIQIGGEPPRYDGTVLDEDPDAVDGLAYKSTIGVAGNMIFAYSWERMGVYEAKFRLKTADNTIKEPVVNIRYYCETSKFHNLPADIVSSRRLKGSDFKSAGAYEEFTLRWITPHQGRNGWVVASTGKGEVWFDQIRVRKVRPVTEAELLEVLANASTPPDPTPRTGPWRAHLTRGYYSDYYLLDLALARVAGLRVSSSSFSNKSGASGHPAAGPELYANDLLIMAGTNISHLSISMRVAITKWVEAGGSLFILGGPVSFSQSDIGESMLGELLPVNMTGPFDLKRSKTTLRPSDDTHPMVAGIDWSAPMVAAFRHAVTVRPNATVVLGSPDAPVLVTGNYKKGRVACFLTPPMGRDDEASEGETLFWNDARLPQLFANVARALMTRPAPKHAHQWHPNEEPSPEAAALLERMSTGGLDDDDDLALGDDDDEVGGDGEDAPLNMTPESLAVLTAGGGKESVPFLLRALPTLAEKEDIRKVQWALSSHLDKGFGDKVIKITEHMQSDIRNAAIALLGASGAIHRIATFTRTDDVHQQRAVCQSILDGKVKAQIPYLKRVHAELKPVVRDLQLRRYEGYWFAGLPPDDPAWVYAECTMALLAMGEKGYLKDALDLLFILHIQDIKIRSFIFLYNPKVPREAKASVRHARRNRFVRPDLTRLLERFHLCLSNLPAALHDEYVEALLELNDHEKMIRPLYSVYDLHAVNPERWQKRLATIESHALKLALSAKRW